MAGTEKRGGEDKKQQEKKTYRRDINKGYIILYLGVFIIIIIGEIILYNLPDFPLADLAKDTIGNLMGVLAAFLVFDIAHEKINKDSYASEVSEQILDTLMYHPETMELYENNQKKTFVNSFIGSIVDDEDASEMINNHLNCYLLTQKDFEEKEGLTEKDCRIKKAFSYRFILETERTNAFTDLKAPRENDPYFYMQEEINYTVKYLAPQGNYTDREEVKIAFIYDNAALDRFLRGNKSKEEKEMFKNCLFREGLDIEDVDREFLHEACKDKDTIVHLVKKMFRPHLSIDRSHGEVVDVREIPDSGLIIVFRVAHDCRAMEHNIDIICHLPKRYDSIVEVALVEPTKNPKISLSYNEDMMDVEMYPFLNKGDSSSYEYAYENENGVYSITLSNEWVFPISGVVFFVRRDKTLREP